MTTVVIVLWVYTTTLFTYWAPLDTFATLEECKRQAAAYARALCLPAGVRP